MSSELRCRRLPAAKSPEKNSRVINPLAIQVIHYLLIGRRHVHLSTPCGGDYLILRHFKSVVAEQHLYAGSPAPPCVFLFFCFSAIRRATLESIPVLHLSILGSGVDSQAMPAVEIFGKVIDADAAPTNNAKRRRSIVTPILVVIMNFKCDIKNYCWR
jgi:hypothetical protein